MLMRIKGKGDRHLLLVGLQSSVATMEFSAENDEKAESSPTIKHNILHKYSTPLHTPKGPIFYLSIPVPLHTPKDLIFYYKDMFYCHSLDNNKEMETTWMPFNWCMGNENVIHGGILFSCEGKRNLATYRWLDKTGKHYREWGKSDQNDKPHMFSLNHIWVYIPK